MLELKSLDAGYGSFQALFGVNLDVKAGEAVGVIWYRPRAGEPPSVPQAHGRGQPQDGRVHARGTRQVR